MVGGVNAEGLGDVDDLALGDLLFFQDVFEAAFEVEADVDDEVGLAEGGDVGGAEFVAVLRAAGLHKDGDGAAGGQKWLDEALEGGDGDDGAEAGGSRRGGFPLAATRERSDQHRHQAQQPATTHGKHPQPLLRIQTQQGVYGQRAGWFAGQRSDREGAAAYTRAQNRGGSSVGRAHRSQ